MTETRRRIAAGSLLAIVLAAAPSVLAPTSVAATTWTDLAWPLAALFLVYEIQAWISLPGKWARMAGVREAQATAATPSADTSSYLDAVDSALGLPPEVRAEIRAELSDHLDDSIEALEAEGLDRARATREALARLGRAEELARQLRAAHQSTRRLLAGAAGGVWSAGVGMVQGYLAVLGLVALALDLGVLFLQRSVEALGVSWNGIKIGPSDLETTTALLCVMAWVPAFVAGRRCVRASSRLSRRKARQLRGFWAVAGVSALGWLVTFQIGVQQSWLVVPCELAIPAAFAAGALLRPDVSLHLPRSRSKLALVPAAIVVGGLLMGAAVPDYGSEKDSLESWPSDSVLGYDRIAPEGYVPCDPALPPMTTDGRCVVPFGGGSLGIDDFKGPWAGQWLVDGLKQAPFTSMRIEVWRALAGVSEWDMTDTAGFAVDPRGAAPYLIEPATLDGYFRIPADLGTHRQRRWLVIVTGVDSDGRRYRLGDPLWFRTPFTGTIWDWLTAPD